MSENALLIDLMEARASHQEAHSTRGLHRKLLELPELPSSGCGDNCSTVVDWIDTQLRDLDRVEAYSQVFQTDVAVAPRTNVYGILRASPLADGKVRGCRRSCLITFWQDILIISFFFVSLGSSCAGNALP